MRNVLSTDNIGQAERLSFWNDVICKTYVKLDCNIPDKDTFRGDIISYDLPDLNFSIINSTDQTVSRTKSAISTDTENWLISSFQLKGKSKISQNGREAFLLAGDFAIYDSSQPYHLTMEGEFEQIVLKIRLNTLKSRLSDVEELTAKAISSKTGAGNILINMLKTLKHEADNLDYASASAVTSGIVSVLAGGLQPLTREKNNNVSNLANYHLERIKQQIDNNLSDSTLDIQSLANHVNLSCSHIHRLFQSQSESASQYLWRRRLESCQRDIINPNYRHISLAEIAFRWGFNDAAHFSRLYRSHFGCSPSQQRQQAI
ncbi:helix-turn-helix domain-containing protein [Marinomonas sp. TI.3.20]|uniref:AraC-like ligand-binding domain-containing protein n=1 Tax=Marinomonas sp. TI.3.20 TaxID=3121296 RepID=UPI00311EA01B